MPTPPSPPPQGNPYAQPTQFAPPPGGPYGYPAPPPPHQQQPQAQFGAPAPQGNPYAQPAQFAPPAAPAAPYGAPAAAPGPHWAQQPGPVQGAWGQGPYAQGGFAGPCRGCGAPETVKGTVCGHRGLIVLMTHLRLEGPHCKVCGTVALRDMTSATLWQGWWGPASLVVFTPIALIRNGILSSRLSRLPEPSSGLRIPPTSKPVLHRPGSYVPFVLILLFLLLAATG